MSASEVHACVKRATACHLLHGRGLMNRPNLTAVEEFLVRGLRYVFPAERGELARGVPTSYAAAPLSRLIVPGTEPIPVWPSGDGTERGIAFAPLYKTAAMAAMRDARFYELLALADALRSGGPREREVAEQALRRQLWGSDE